MPDLDASVARRPHAPQPRRCTPCNKLVTGNEGGPPELLGNDRQRELLAAVDAALGATSDEGRQLILEALHV